MFTLNITATWLTFADIVDIDGLTRVNVTGTDVNVGDNMNGGVVVAIIREEGPASMSVVSC